MTIFNDILGLCDELALHPGVLSAFAPTSIFTMTPMGKSGPSFQGPSFNTWHG